MVCSKRAAPVSIQDVKPFADGSRVRLDVGNLTTATVIGCTFFAAYGLRAPDNVESFGQRPKMRTKEIKVTKDLRPGVWNRDAYSPWCPTERTWVFNPSHGNRQDWLSRVKGETLNGSWSVTTQVGGHHHDSRLCDHRKTYFFGLSPTGHRSRQPRLWRGIGGNGSVQRLNRPQIEPRQRVGERRGAGELIVPPP